MLDGSLIIISYSLNFEEKLISCARAKLTSCSFEQAFGVDFLLQSVCSQDHSNTTLNVILHNKAYELSFHHKPGGGAHSFSD